MFLGFWVRVRATINKPANVARNYRGNGKSFGEPKIYKWSMFGSAIIRPQ